MYIFVCYILFATNDVTVISVNRLHYFSVAFNIILLN